MLGNVIMVKECWWLAMEINTVGISSMGKSMAKVPMISRKVGLTLATSAKARSRDRAGRSQLSLFLSFFPSCFLALVYDMFAFE